MQERVAAGSGIGVRKWDIAFNALKSREKISRGNMKYVYEHQWLACQETVNNSSRLLPGGNNQ